MDQEALLKAIQEHDAKFIDFRFTDTLGKSHHITAPVSTIDAKGVVRKMFDGSSIAGWQSIHESDLELLPDYATIILDPFYEATTLAVQCNVIDPQTGEYYDRASRTMAMRAETYLKSTGIADSAMFGPEAEFFIFDEVRWQSSINENFCRVNSHEGIWNSGEEIEGGNTGHRPGIKGGYFPLPPMDSSQDIRSRMSEILDSVGVRVEVHHHEVATANQCEITTRYDSLLKKADQLQLFKYVVRNVAHNYGKTATFMPKPLMGDNGSGMHCHQSLMKDGVNLFAGDGYAGLSEIGLFYIGGIIKHARVLNAFTNPATNSYKRLIPGFEAPVLLSYAKRNRSAAIRIPFVYAPHESRIEVRFPDPLANPYLAFSAMMLAGLDGILNKIYPGEPIDKDLYELPPAELQDIPTVCSSLEEAIHYLEHMDYQFLLQGDVFSIDFLKSYIALKKKEITEMRNTVHAHEFELYYSL